MRRMTSADSISIDILAFNRLLLINAVFYLSTFLKIFSRIDCFGSKTETEFASIQAIVATQPTYQHIQKMKCVIV